MGTKQLEQRVAKLESEFEKMKAGVACTTGQGWRAIVGTHEGSSAFDNVMQQMRQLRREDYQQAATKDAESKG